ncbi:MAG: oligosaccharide flippase family protein, partial [Paludibacter sp.]|nr:oligosaccharide flippase family protein [Paludibacter sp.]
LLLNSFHFFSTDTIIKWLIPLGLFPLISNSLFMLYIAYFQSQKEIKLLSSLTVYNKLLSIVGVIAFAYFLGIKGYYIAYNLSFIMMLVVVFVFIKKTVKFSKIIDIRRKLKEHWEYARANLMAGVIAESSALVDIILLSFLIDDMQEIGFYSFALTLTIALRIFPATVQQITIPYFSSFTQKKEEFLKIFNKYNMLLYIVVFGSLILFLIFMPLVIEFFYGKKFDNSYRYLIFLSIGWSIRNLNQLQSGAIFGLGKIKYNAFTVFYVLIGNLIVYPIAIYNFGIMGAAYASISSGIIFWIASSYYFKKAVKESAWNV